jgi:c-di-GMP-binding flagellar brake protein YcgR
VKYWIFLNMTFDQSFHGEERRKSKRFDIPVDVEYRTLTQNPLYGNVVTRDLSRGGVSVQGAKEFKRGLTVQLKMNVSGDNLPVFATGMVAWTDGFQSGLRLTKISQADQERILEHIYQRWLKSHEWARAEARAV